MYIETNFDTLVKDAYYKLQYYQTPNKKLILPDIIVEIVTTRLHWKNVKDYLKTINRHPDHFIEWLKTELPNLEINWFSGSKSDGLIIHGKRQKKSNIIDIALKYINIYIICPSCKQTDTTMTKFNHKQWEFKCEDCGMKKFVV